MHLDERVGHGIPSDPCERGSKLGAFVALVKCHAIFRRPHCATERRANFRDD